MAFLAALLFVVPCIGLLRKVSLYCAPSTALKRQKGVNSLQEKFGVGTKCSLTVVLFSDEKFPFHSWRTLFFLFRPALYFILIISLPAGGP